MTNEQLAIFVGQGGNDELIPLLWENVRKLLYMRADRYYRAYKDDCSAYGITSWDLRQAAYTAFLNAIPAYKRKSEEQPDKEYKFTSFLKYPFKNAIRNLLTKDILNTSDSLNRTVTDSDGNNDSEQHIKKSKRAER